MKKMLILTTVIAIITALALAGCAVDGDDGNNNNGNGAGTTLKISNQSSSSLINVKWDNTKFSNATEYTVYYSWGVIQAGTSVAEDVEAGSGYVYFVKKSPYMELRTSELLTVEKGKNGEFTITDNTLVVELGNTGNTGTLGTITP